MIKLLFVFAAGLPVSAQVISLGVKAGALLTDPVDFRRSFGSAVETTRFTGGPSVEVHLPFRLSIEADAFYQTYRATNVFPGLSFPAPEGPGVSTIFTSESKTRSWQVPVLLKYTFTDGPVRPFVSAGGAWQREWGERLASATCVGDTCPQNFPRTVYSTVQKDRWGPTAGAGVAFSTRYFTVTPEVRYTRLNDPNKNELRALVGFSWGR